MLYAEIIGLVQLWPWSVLSLGLGVELTGLALALETMALLTSLADIT